MIVADASWIIALRDPADPHHTAAVRLSRELGDEPVVVGLVTLAECLVSAAMLGVLADAEAALRLAFQVEQPDIDAAARWAARRATSGLRLPDAIVLETAVFHHARGVATFDAKLAAATTAMGLDVVAGG